LFEAKKSIVMRRYLFYFVGIFIALSGGCASKTDSLRVHDFSNFDNLKIRKNTKSLSYKYGEPYY